MWPSCIVPNCVLCIYRSFKQGCLTRCAKAALEAHKTCGLRWSDGRTRILRALYSTKDLLNEEDLLPSSAVSSRWREVRVGVVVGILWNRGVVRVNVATLNRGAPWITRADLTLRSTPIVKKRLQIGGGHPSIYPSIQQSKTPAQASRP